MRAAPALNRRTGAAPRSMNSLDIAFKLAPDIPQRWERSYRHLLAALDAYLAGDGRGDDEGLESVRIADLEILNEAMRLVYGAMIGTASEPLRYRYLASTPEAVPAWKKAARVGRSFAGLRERYRPAALIRPERDVC